MISVRIIGAGRAGLSFSAALADAGCNVDRLFLRGEHVFDAAHGVDAVLLATPDAVIADVCQQIDPDDHCVMIHLSGALDLDVLRPHARRASLHPLAPLPSAEIGRKRLQEHIFFAVSGDPIARGIVEVLSGVAMTVDETQRSAYHAAASISSNHVVAVMGEVAGIVERIGLEFEPFVRLARYALEDVSTLGPAVALTGPVVRRDEKTVTAHRAALTEQERAGYDAGVALIRQLVLKSESEPT